MTFLWVSLTIEIIIMGSLVKPFTSAIERPYTLCSEADPGYLTVFINTRDVTIDFIVEAIDDELRPWRLDALVEWPPPNGTAEYSYSVEFRPTIELSEAMNPQNSSYDKYLDCPPWQCPTEPSLPRVTNETSVMFADLLFGFAYYFQIQVIVDAKPAAVYYCFTACSKCANTNAPDCLKATGDEDFCRDQPLATASIPRNLTAEVIYGATKKESFLFVSWEEPWKNKAAEITRYYLTVRKNGLEEPLYEESLDPSNHSHEIPCEALETANSQDTFFDISVESHVDLPPGKEVRAPDATIRLNASTITAVFSTTVQPSRPATEPNRVTNQRPKTEPPDEFPYIIVVGSSVGPIIIFVALCTCLGFCFCNMKTEEEPKIQSVFVPKHTQKKEKRTMIEFVLPEFRGKEIPTLDSLEVVGDPIGSGQYGKVYIGMLWSEEAGGEPIQVAVKTTKDGLSASMKEEFLDEIRLMLDIGEHPNIMQVLACQTVAEPYYLVTEYMEYGSLKDYFQKCRKPEFRKHNNPAFVLTEYMKLGICHQICEGMTFLSDTRYFHGDLAARNVLINQKMEVKISDFGLSNDIYQRGYFRLPPEDKRPVKWYSPEANVHGRCSTEGDVWSYGVVLYEIYTVGGEPYPGMNPREVIIQVKHGYRMDKPEGCPDQMYDIMLKCWEYEAEDRPTFISIRETLKEFVEEPELLFGSLDDVKRQLKLSLPIEENAQTDRYSVASFTTDDSLNGEMGDIQIELDHEDI